MSGIVVRKARIEDVGLLVSFNQRLGHETEGKELEPARLEAGVRAVLDDPSRGTYFVVDEEGRSVGGCLITREWSDWRAADFWWLQSVFVLPEARGRGVFRALYERVLASAREDPAVCGLRLYVERENERAQAVYRVLGMKESQYRLLEIDFVLGEAAAPTPKDPNGAGPR